MAPRRAAKDPVSLSTDSVLVRDQEPCAAVLAGGTVLLSLREGAYFGFNGVASEIWDMLAAPRRVAEIFAALKASHEVDADTLTRDVTPFLQELIDQRLLLIVEPSEAR